MESLRRRLASVQGVALAFALWSIGGAAVAFAGNASFDPSSQGGWPLALNGWHGLLHLVPGAVGLWAYRSAATARAYLLAAALAYLGAVVWGLADGANAYGLVAVDAGGNLLHAAEAAVAAFGAFLPSRSWRVGAP